MDAAASHVIERVAGHFQGRFVAGSFPASQEQLQFECVRKLGGGSEAPVHAVISPAQVSERLVQNLWTENFAAGLERTRHAQVFGDIVRAAVDFAAAGFPGNRQRFQQTSEGGPAVSILWWEI